MSNKTDLTACGFIFYQDKVLLIYNKKYSMWLGVGGHIQDNETPIDTLKRKTKQEVNVEVNIVSPLNKTIDTIIGNTVENSPIPFHADTHSVGDHNHYAQYYICIPKNTNNFNPRIGKEEQNITEIRMFNNIEILNDQKVPEVTKKIVNLAYILLKDGNLIYS